MTDIQYLMTFYKLKDHQTQYFHDYIHSKLSDAGLTDYDGFMSYWRDSTPQLPSERPQGVKSPWRYDCTALIALLLNQSFTLELGDVLSCGTGGSGLIFNDGEFASRICRALTERSAVEVEMNDGNITFWNDALQAGKVQISSTTIKEIMSKRGKSRLHNNFTLIGGE